MGWSWRQAMTVCYFLVSGCLVLFWFFQFPYRVATDLAEVIARCFF